MSRGLGDVYKRQKLVSVLIGLFGLIILFASGATGLSGDGDIITGGTLAIIGVQGLALSNITNKKDSQYIPARTYLLVQWVSSTVFSILLFFILGGELEMLNRSQSLRLSGCLLYTSPSPRDMRRTRMPSSA